MRTETHVLNEIHAHRYQGDNAQYALVISHGLGGHGGIYDRFCEHHAPRGADIWSYDGPGHGRSTTNRPRGTWTMEEWAQASRDYATHVADMTGLPVFGLGSSLGVAPTISAIDCPAMTGAVLMGSLAVPGSPLLTDRSAPWRSPEFAQIIEQLGRGARLDIPTFFDFDADYGYPGATEQKKLDPYNTWSYDLASWASFFQYDPPKPLAENTKPILYAAGEKDALAPRAAVEKMVEGIGGPVEIEIVTDAPHQLMLFATETFSDLVHNFCTSNL